MKKRIVFILWAFLPMVAVGLVMRFSGASAVGLPENPSGIDPLAAIKGLVFSAGAMLIPLLAVIFTQLIFNEPVFKGLGISFKLNRWWWIGWLLMPVIAFAVLGVTLLMPGAKWTPDSDIMLSAMRSMPSGIGIWGLWHAPIILNGHNYPQHPVAGVFMMVVFCLLITPMFLYFRKKSGSVIVPAIMHGTFNAVVGLSAAVVTPANDLLYGGAGLAGFIVLLLVDICLCLYDKYISKEKVFTAQLSSPVSEEPNN